MEELLVCIDCLLHIMYSDGETLCIIMLKAHYQDSGMAVEWTICWAQDCTIFIVIILHMYMMTTFLLTEFQQKDRNDSKCIVHHA